MQVPRCLRTSSHRQNPSGKSRREPALRLLSHASARHVTG